MTTPYVDVDDVIAALPPGIRPDPESEDPTDVAKVARLTSLCASSAQVIDAEIPPINFHRRPAAGDDDPVALILDGRDSSRLHVHAGAISVESIEVRYALTDEWVELDTDEWELVSMFESEDPDRPYDHIDFIRRLPTFRRGVRVTGHFGWTAPPPRLVEMNVAWIRQSVAASDSYSGAAQIPDGSFPTPRLVLPDPVRMFLTAESRRYAACYT